MLLKNDLKMVKASLLPFLFISSFSPSLEAASSAQEGQASSQARLAAKVGGDVIVLQEVEKEVAAQLAKLEEEKYHLLQSKLDEMIGERLLAQEARRRGVTVAELLAFEVEAKTPRLKDEEIAASVQKNRGALRGDEELVRKRARDDLWTQRLAQQRALFIESLKKATPVTVLLEEPVPFRVQLTVDGAFFKGPKDVPVTIVEFSDFQCPFCRRVIPTIKELMGRYAGKVKWVFRDFPIASIHPQAMKAAEAARCAGEQGKFWEYHDTLFDNQTRLTAADVMAFAEQLRLDPSAFGQCLRTGKYQAAVEADIQEGRRVGVTGTPTFFINGRSLSGAQPLPAFQRIIESELRQAPTSGTQAQGPLEPLSRQ